MESGWTRANNSSVCLRASARARAESVDGRITAKLQHTGRQYTELYEPSQKQPAGRIGCELLVLSPRRIGRAAQRCGCGDISFTDVNCRYAGIGQRAAKHVAEEFSLRRMNERVRSQNAIEGGQRTAGRSE